MSLRMAAWYAGTSFVLILLATSMLYWSFDARISSQEDRSLSALAQALRPLIGGTKPVLSQLIANALGEKPNRSGVRLRVIGSRGRIILQSPGMDLPLPQPADIVQDKQVADRRGTLQPRFRTIESNGETFRTLTEPLPGGQRLQIAVASTASRALLLRYRESITFILAVSIILSAVLGYVIAQSGMRPIEQIAATAERIRSSTLHERLDFDGLPAELAALANTFNLMLDRLEYAFLQLSQFSADLAHELRTPVGNLRGEIEVALSRPRSDENYREILGSALEECTRITRIIQSLLFLARAEMADEPPALETMTLAHEIATVIEFYQPMAAEVHLVLVDDVAPGIIIRFDRILLQQALGNLISNAITHTGADGRIVVKALQRAEQVIIHVEDTGRGIAPEHLPHVFARFYRADRARSHGGGHLGLGLAMVRAIMDLHGGHVTIESWPHRGTTVTLHIPSFVPDRATVKPD